MTDIALRPRSSTELVDAAFQVYRRDPLQFMLPTAAVYIPWLVVRLVFDLGVSGQLPNAGQLMAMIALGTLVYTIVSGAVTVVASDVYLGQSPDTARAFRAVLERAVPLLVASVVTFVLVALGAVFFLLPALYPLARFFAVRQAVMLERASGPAALVRSSALSVGVKRHVLNTVLLVLLLGIAVSAGAAMVLSLIPSRVVVNVIGTALNIVIYPFFGITETLLYYDVRIRKEGFDVEYLASAAGAQAGESAAAS